MKVSCPRDTTNQREVEMKLFRRKGSKIALLVLAVVLIFGVTLALADPPRPITPPGPPPLPIPDPGR
jgi:hypothetical protein